MDVGATVCLFAVELAAATEEWRAESAGGREGFDAVVERRATARIYDAPLAPLAGLFAAVARASKARALELAGLDAAPPAYPMEVRRSERDDGSGLRLWLPAPAPVAGAAAAAKAVVDAAPRGVDAALWADLAEAVEELCEAAARPGMAIVGSVTS